MSFLAKFEQNYIDMQGKTLYEFSGNILAEFEHKFEQNLINTQGTTLTAKVLRFMISTLLIFSHKTTTNPGIKNLLLSFLREV